MADGDHVGGDTGVNQHTVAEEAALHGNVALIVIQEHHTANLAAAGLQEHGICRAGTQNFFTLIAKLIDCRLDNGGFLVAKESIFTGMGIQGRHGDIAAILRQEQAHHAKQLVGSGDDSFRRQLADDVPECTMPYHSGAENILALDHGAAGIGVIILFKQIKFSTIRKLGFVECRFGNGSHGETVNDAGTLQLHRLYHAVILQLAAVRCYRGEPDIRTCRNIAEITHVHATLGRTTGKRTDVKIFKSRHILARYPESFQISHKNRNILPVIRKYSLCNHFRTGTCVVTQNDTEYDFLFHDLSPL